MKTSSDSVVYLNAHWAADLYLCINLNKCIVWGCSGCYVFHVSFSIICNEALHADSNSELRVFLGKLQVIKLKVETLCPLQDKRFVVATRLRVQALP
jgi:hypothetical protein